MITKDSSNIRCRARNPRFLMLLFGQKTGFRDRMNEIKSGIPCSAWTGIARPPREATLMRTGFWWTRPFCNELMVANFMPTKRRFLERWTKQSDVRYSVLYPDPEVPYLKMFIRARNAVWLIKWAIGDFGVCLYLLVRKSQDVHRTSTDSARRIDVRDSVL
jgi:hypothetical protein